MKKYILLIFFIFLISGCSSQIQKVCFTNKCFNVEIANTDKDREIGLMNRTYLGKNDGMLFIFDKEDSYSFWMKNTLIPLDIIWINSDKKIVYIKENALPCNLFSKKLDQKEEKCEVFNPEINAKYVLEVNGGLSKELNIKIGDSVLF